MFSILLSTCLSVTYWILCWHAWCGCRERELGRGFRALHCLFPGGFHTGLQGFLSVVVFTTTWLWPAETVYTVVCSVWLGFQRQWGWDWGCTWHARQCQRSNLRPCSCPGTLTSNRTIFEFPDAVSFVCLLVLLWDHTSLCCRAVFGLIVRGLCAGSWATHAKCVTLWIYLF